MKKAEHEAKTYLTIGIMLVFVLALFFFPWKYVLMVAIAWFAFNAFYLGVKKIREEKDA